MKLGIMQPYFFPYIGYWQLINALDLFVIYDDVNFINRGWINRNVILVNKQAKQINLQLFKASQNKRINEIEILGDHSYNNKVLKTIEDSYKKAPYYYDVFPLIKELFMQNQKNLAKYLEVTIKEICKYIGISTQIILSSDLEKNNNLRGQDKIIEICKILQANEYINAIGGMQLYSKADFLSNGINLRFLNTGEVRYKQFNHDFLANLSIIDVMMFNSVEEIKLLLGEFVLC